MVGCGAIDYNVVAVDAAISFDEARDKVSAIGVCTHGGNYFPRREDILGILDMFPNLTKVDYNVIDARVGDKTYWPFKLSDIGESSDFKIKPEKNYPKDIYLSNIPMTGKIFEDIKQGYEKVFQSARTRVEEEFSDMERKDPQIVVFDTDMESGKHAFLSDRAIQLLKERSAYRLSGNYNKAGTVREDLEAMGLFIVYEDRNNSQTFVREESHAYTADKKNTLAAIDEDKSRFMDFLQHASNLSNGYAYTSHKELSLAEFQATMHEVLFREIIEEYNLKTGKYIAFEGVTFIPKEMLKDPKYNHVKRHHKSQQAVFLPVLQGRGNGEVKEHIEYIQDKYIRALIESKGADLPRFILYPKEFKSMFSK